MKVGENMDLKKSNKVFIKLGSTILFISMFFQYICISSLDIGILTTSTSFFTCTYLIIMIIVIPLIVIVFLFGLTLFVIQLIVYIPVSKMAQVRFTTNTLKQFKDSIIYLLNKNKYRVLRC